MSGRKDCKYHRCLTDRNIPKFFNWVFAVFTLSFLFFSVDVQGQDEPLFDEISVYFQIQNVGSIEIPALIRDEQVLLPVNDIFNFLKIKSAMSQSMDSISGFFISPQATYLVNRVTNTITYRGKAYPLKSGDLVRTETNLYLLSKYFGEIFELECKFSFRALSVNMSTKVELPAMREMRLEQMRQNISRLKGETKADTIIRKSKPLFHFGMADWSVISTQQLGDKIDNRINLALGSVIAGGEANVYLNFNTNEKFSEKQQYYYLKFVNNNNAYLRQTTFGKIATDAISSIYNPVVGVRLTNTPTTYRRSFGTYPLSDYTSPNWMVELYVNNVLVDYKKADASGFFNFQVPLVYGSSNIKLKFYGPWGEERSKEQQITVPFNFLPPGDFEYTVNAGMVEDSLSSIYTRAAVNYGVSRAITFGVGVEYLSSVTSGNMLPFASLATRPLSSMLLSLEYVYGVKGKGILSYQFPGNMQLELNYTKFKEGQKAINFNYLEERKAIFTLPIKTKSFSFYNRMTYNQIVLSGTGYSTAEWLVSGAVFGVSTNLTNYAMFVKNNQPYVYSNLSFSFRLPRGFMLTPQFQYEYSNNELISFKSGLEKYLSKNGFLSLSYENNFKNNIQSVQLGFRYDLPFAQAGFTARQTNDATTLLEMARGSLIIDQKTHYFGTNSRISVSKGGIVFAPYLDLNCNNRKDKGEPRAKGLNIRISGGTATENPKDSTVRVTDLEPYINYLVELDANSFDNVAWKIRNKTLLITVDPNQFKLVDIPIAVVGEVSGTVFRQKGKNQDGIGRVLVNVFDLKSRLVGRTMTEQDGYYSYLGLAPGKYNVKVDTTQMNKLHLVATPDKQEITIKQNRDGDLVEGFDFVLNSTDPEIPDTIKLVPANVQVPDAFVSTDTAKPAAAPTQATTAAQPALTKQSAQTVQSPQTAQTAQPAQTAQNQSSAQKQGIAQPTTTGSLASAGQKTPSGKQTAATTASNSAQQKIAAQKSPTTPPSKAGAPKTNAPLSQSIPPTPAASSTQGTQQTQATQQAQGSVSAENLNLRKYYFVQIGAFRIHRNATRLVEAINKMIPYPIVIALRDNLYKIRYGGFETKEEAERVNQLVIEANISSPNLIKIEYDFEDAPVAKPVSATPVPGIYIQVGAFREMDKAKDCLNKMVALAPYPTVIVKDRGFYKVKFGPFATEKESKACQAVLRKNGVEVYVAKSF